MLARHQATPAESATSRSHEAGRSRGRRRTGSLRDRPAPADRRRKQPAPLARLPSNRSPHGRRTYGPFAPHINLGYHGTVRRPGRRHRVLHFGEDLPTLPCMPWARWSRYILASRWRSMCSADTSSTHRACGSRISSHSTVTAVFPNIAFDTGSINELSSAVGLKINVAGRLLLNTNLLMRLNSEGLRESRRSSASNTRSSLTSRRDEARTRIRCRRAARSCRAALRS